jgi:hypothetical protein
MIHRTYFRHFDKTSSKSLKIFTCSETKFEHYSIDFIDPEIIEIQKFTTTTYSEKTSWFKKFIRDLKMTGAKFELTKDENGRPRVFMDEFFMFKNENARAELMRIFKEWEEWFHTSGRCFDDGIIVAKNQASDLILKCRSDLVLYDCIGLEKEFKEKLIQIINLQLEWFKVYSNKPFYKRIMGSINSGEVFAQPDSEETKSHTSAEEPKKIKEKSKIQLLVFEWKKDKQLIEILYKELIENGLIGKETKKEIFLMAFCGSKIDEPLKIRWMALVKNRKNSNKAALFYLFYQLTEHGFLHKYERMAINFNPKVGAVFVDFKGNPIGYLKQSNFQKNDRKTLQKNAIDHCIEKLLE